MVVEYSIVKAKPLELLFSASAAAKTAYFAADRRRVGS